MRRTRYLAGMLAVGIATAAGVAVVWPRGVRVTVTNRGPEPLVGVVVHVTGNQYRLGTLAAGECQTVSVQPHGESHLELEFTNPVGERVRLDAGGYFESSGYQGTIEVDLESGVLARNEHRISVGPF